MDEAPRIEIESVNGDTLRLVVAGRWQPGAMPTALAPLLAAIGSAPTLARVGVDASRLIAADSGLNAALLRLARAAAERGAQFDPADLPEGPRRMLELALAVPEQETAEHHEEEHGLLGRLGEGAIALWRSTGALFRFVGEVTQGLGRLARREARFHRADLGFQIQKVGAEALPIVTLIAFLVGMILAFIGAIQLQQFGAQIFVANLVGIAMVREMGAMMTGIIMAGRTGAAFAAQLGTMQVNEEIDALRVTGLKPIDFLVLPRLLAALLMVPLLCLYADAVGIIGGMVIGVGLLDLSFSEYLHQTQYAITLPAVTIGVVKGAVYGLLVALAGCARGLAAGRNASAVGAATTSAVVTAIVAIIVADALFNILLNRLGI